MSEIWSATDKDSGPDLRFRIGTQLPAWLAEKRARIRGVNVTKLISLIRFARNIRRNTGITECFG